MPADKKSFVSDASSYEEIGAYWDEQHDITTIDGTYEVSMQVEIESSRVYFGVERSLADRFRSIAQDHGVSPEALLQQLVEQHVASGPSK
jgi:hypothetical protein